MEEVRHHKPVRIRVSRNNLSQSFYAEVMALNLGGNISGVVPLILDDAANFRAMELAASFGRNSACIAVYLIAPDDLDVVKVGIAADPRLRLSALQVGNWNKLSVRGLLWFDGSAGDVERLVHQAAAEMNISVRGEWIGAPIAEAAELVLKAARYSKRKCYDSDIWIKNWSSRVGALADSKSSSKRIAA